MKPVYSILVFLLMLVSCAEAIANGESYIGITIFIVLIVFGLILKLLAWLKKK